MRKWKVERKRLKTLHFVRQEFEKLLKENNIDSFSLDTRVIITHILDIEYIEYVLEKDRIITTNEYNEILKIFEKIKKDFEKIKKDFEENKS